MVRKQFLSCFMKTLSELSQRLVEERKKRGLSQKDMLMLIGMSQQQYQRIESGKDLKVSTLLRILAGLELELTLNEPSELEAGSVNAQGADGVDVWASKHKHLED